MNQADCSPHPDPATLQQFALGRLRSEVMLQVERHLQVCEGCLQVALAAPDDRLVALLRRAAPGPCEDPRDPITPSGEDASP
jgi:hypothetical protein